MGGLALFNYITTPDLTKTLISLGWGQFPNFTTTGNFSKNLSNFLGQKGLALFNYTTTGNFSKNLSNFLGEEGLALFNYITTPDLTKTLISLDWGQFPNYTTTGNFLKNLSNFFGQVRCSY